MSMSLATRLNGLFSLGMITVLAVALAVSMTLSGNAQRRALQATMETFSLERGQQTAALQKSLEDKAESVAKLLSLIAPQPILNFDYEALEAFAESTMRDPDIAYVTFRDEGGEKLAGKDPVAGVRRIVRDLTLDDKKVGELEIGMLQERSVALIRAMEERFEQFRGRMAEENQAMRRQAVLWSAAVGLLVLLAGIGIISLLVVRGIVRPVDEVIGLLERIGQGHYDNRVTTTRRDEIGRLLLGLASMQEKLARDVQTLKDRAQEARRIQVALDNVSTGVVVTDSDYRISYMNAAVLRLFRAGETELRRARPDLDLERLPGSPLEDLFPEPQEQRTLWDSLQHTHRARLQTGNRTFQVVTSPVLDQDGQRLGAVLEWDDLTETLQREQEEQQKLAEERRQAAAIARIQQALDMVSSNVMVADARHDIIYVNRSLMETFQIAEADFRRAIPEFTAASLVGSNIDRFHEDPARIRRLVEELERPLQMELTIGGRTMRFVGSPVRDRDGTRLGTVVEWHDRTEEVLVEQEVAAIVASAQHGDLSQRIDLAGKHGFLRTLGEDINRFLDVVADAFGAIGQAMHWISAGDLRHTIDKDYQGAFAEVQGHVNATIERLRETVRGIREASGQITVGAARLADGNRDLSARTEQQASSLEQTATSMEELTGTVHTTADNAQQANRMAREAGTLAEKGGKVVSDAVQAMDTISASSHKIAEIIGVIDEIAFQTNLLALNASVEAARAGEQGRGFSVVATEVRHLAQRSATAAKEIKELIRDSVAKVATGTELVHASGCTLEEIVGAVSKVGSVVSEIAAAAQEQMAGITQVNQSIAHMDGMTQKNAGLAEQIAVSSASMQEQAGHMARQIAFFGSAG